MDTKTGQFKMIDLHCHLLPGIDDGSPNLETSLEMARIAVADGIKVMACTPHIQPGVFNNHPEGIRHGVGRLQDVLNQQGIPLKLVVGCDAHVRHDFLAALADGRLATINDTRYVLFEPPHHVVPPRMETLLFDVLAAGYIPILTHPERLTWIAPHYEMLKRLARSGVWMQITSGSLTGRFGKGPQALGERMLEDGLVNILATDAHNARRRPPLLREGERAAARIVGDEEAHQMVTTRPRVVIENGYSALPPKSLVRPEKTGLFARMFAR